jgi:hypothetical protein
VPVAVEALQQPNTSQQPRMLYMGLRIETYAYPLRLLCMPMLT